VSARDLAAAVRVLQAAGYTAAPPPGDPRARCEQTCYDPSWRRLPVDLHWTYAGEPYPLGVDCDGVLARAEEIAVCGERALLPSPADLVVALGAHVLHDVWTSTPRVRYLRDAAEVARHPVDWRRVLQTAEEAPEARPALWLTLSAATDLLGAPVPPAVIAALAPRRRGAGRWVLARFCATVLRRASPAESLALVAVLRWAGGADGGYARLAGARIRAQARRVRNHLRWRLAQARGGDPRPWRVY